MCFLYSIGFINFKVTIWNTHPSTLVNIKQVTICLKIYKVQNWSTALNVGGDKGQRVAEELSFLSNFKFVLFWAICMSRDRHQGAALARLNPLHDAPCPLFQTFQLLAHHPPSSPSTHFHEFTSCQKKSFIYVCIVLWNDLSYNEVMVTRWEDAFDYYTRAWRQTHNLPCLHIFSIILKYLRFYFFSKFSSLLDDIVPSKSSYKEQDGALQWKLLTWNQILTPFTQYPKNVITSIIYLLNINLVFLNFKF